MYKINENYEMYLTSKIKVNLVILYSGLKRHKDVTINKVEQAI